ncbi:MAG: hypothetical protein ACXVB9_21175 [Bdellovibrionota bacterium]
MRAYSIIAALLLGALSARAAGGEAGNGLSAWEKAHPAVKLQHMDDPKRCVLCHDSASPDRLVMLDGARVAYADAPKLCGQCHGLKFRDWENGLHGKLLHKGFPDAHRLACVECHDPHSPKFKAMTAVPAPHRPKFERGKREDHGAE